MKRAFETNDPLRVDFDNDDRGQRTDTRRTDTRRYADAIGTTLIGQSAFAYDSRGLTTGIRHADGLGTTLVDYSYARDAAGQITQWTHHGETIDFSHDAAGQLTGADYATQTDEAYTYDANGNRINGSNVIGPNNQILSDGTFDYTYDAEGNLIRKTEIANGEYTEYDFDHRNRMVQATTYSAGGVILKEVAYTYDVFNRRISRTVDADGDGPQTAETTYTVYDGEHVWADYDAAGNVLARYLFGDRIDEIIARFRPGEGTTWYLTDHLGTVRDLADANGAILNTITYDSFGNIVNQTNAAAADRFTYTGREWDADLALYYYRARMYDPRLGRFISQDPIGFNGLDVNLYRYIANRTLSAIDPTGKTALLAAR